MRSPLIFLIIVFSACSGTGNSISESDKDTNGVISNAMNRVVPEINTDKSDTNALKAIEMVKDLEEVKDFIVFVDKSSYGHNQVKYQSLKLEKEKRPCYMVNVFEGNEEVQAAEISLLAQMKFKVYVDSHEIYYYDFSKDSAIALEDWRNSDSYKLQ